MSAIPKKILTGNQTYAMRTSFFEKACVGDIVMQRGVRTHVILINDMFVITQDTKKKEYVIFKLPVYEN